MLLPTLGVAIVLTMGPATAAGSPDLPQASWRPSQIAAVEPSATDPAGNLVVWRVVVDPAAVRMPIPPGATDRRVQQLQRRLAELGVYRGEADGVYGRQVAAAVVAVHKLADVERSDVWAVDDWAIDLNHSRIIERHPDESDRLEVDIARQIMFVIRDGAIAAIVPVSSGNGEVYWSKNAGPDGGLVRARTPHGDFRLFKHVDGWRTNYVGSLYKPWYFTPYYAVHGSRRVPSGPASHGCIRIPTWEADHLDSLLELGLPIHIWNEPFEAAPVVATVPEAVRRPIG